jgi:hypothetical protein
MFKDLENDFKDIISTEPFLISQGSVSEII